MKSLIQIVSICVIGCLGVTVSLAEQHKVKGDRVEKNIKIKKMAPSMGGMSGQTEKDVKLDPNKNKRAPSATPINIPKPAPAATPINIPKPTPEATPINIP